MTFNALGLAEPLLRALVAEGYDTPTPVQTQAIPHVLAGSDVLGCAQTGTGKTAAFALPVLQRLMTQASAAPRRRVRALVLAPTRELAGQIGESFATYGRHTKLRHAVVYGGVGMGQQIASLRNGVDVLVATPGRLLDLANRGCCDLRGVEVLILDEADRMLDMGFIHDIRRVVSLLPATPRPQTLLFSATMPDNIRSLAASLLRQPVHVQVAAVSAPADRIEQAVYFVDRANKPALLCHLLETTSITRALVFTRTKRGADHVATKLVKAGIQAEAIHGNKSQNARARALAGFRSGKTAVLVASDIASRGIDIDEISHVVNYDIPNEPETYVHRIGRTARAGASGQAISFCDREERSYLTAIERLMRVRVPVRDDHPVYPARAATPSSPEPRRSYGNGGNTYRADDRSSRPRHLQSASRHHSTGGYSTGGHAGGGHAPAHKPAAAHAASTHAPAHKPAASHAASTHAPAHKPAASHAASTHAPAHKPAASHAASTHAPAHKPAAAHAASTHAPAHKPASTHAPAHKPAGGHAAAHKSAAGHVAGKHTSGHKPTVGQGAGKFPAAHKPTGGHYASGKKPAGGHASGHHGSSKKMTGGQGARR